MLAILLDQGSLSFFAIVAGRFNALVVGVVHSLVYYNYNERQKSLRMIHRIKGVPVKISPHKTKLFKNEITHHDVESEIRRITLLVY